MNAVIAMPSVLSDSGYRAIRSHCDPATNTHWVFMHAPRNGEPPRRQCFHTLLIKEILEYQNRVAIRVRDELASGIARGLSHVVLASDVSGVFNLGGDLDLFARLIRNRNREHLLAYARSCVQGVHAFHAGLGAGLHSVALVQGDALGGGFEAALSCHSIVAEEGVGMGLPEVLFDLFPGMGAYSFLSRRVGPARAERMMLSGTVYSSDELYRLGIVDVLAPKGEGAAAVEEVVRRNRRTPNARRAMHRVREACNPVTIEELMQVTEIWVDTALQLGEKSLKTMERLVKAQQRRLAPEDMADVHNVATLDQRAI
jgi:DSF synthase